MTQSADLPRSADAESDFRIAERPSGVNVTLYNVPEIIKYAYLAIYEEVLTTHEVVRRHILHLGHGSYRRTSIAWQRLLRAGFKTYVDR
jgi:hypothetical protein